MEERHEKALIRKNAFVKNVLNKVKNIIVVVFCFNLSFSVFNILVTPRMRRISYTFTTHHTPCSPFAPSHFLTSICIWNLYLIVDTDDSIDDISLYANNSFILDVFL